jgi:hypothetical protein
MNKKVMRSESKRGQNEKNEKKHILQFVKKNSLQLFVADPLASHFKDDL